MSGGRQPVNLTPTDQTFVSNGGLLECFGAWVECVGHSWETLLAIVTFSSRRATVARILRRLEAEPEAVESPNHTPAPAPPRPSPRSVIPLPWGSTSSDRTRAMFVHLHKTSQGSNKESNKQTDGAKVITIRKTILWMLRVPTPATNSHADSIMCHLWNIKVRLRQDTVQTRPFSLLMTFSGSQLLHHGLKDDLGACCLFRWMSSDNL
ncbi:hypothetical protein BaRGS_00003773 [Batillaria attramentaria]|uniref:Uncharacterized protein n=1 Tax=Batillaria attramentaria TaxID=370345 RepID=A0ABD0LYW4_9CAEN